MKCECNCGNDVQIIIKPLRAKRGYRLCMNCCLELNMYNLKPQHYLALIRKHDKHEFMLHDDFYDYETGEALQPVR